jgi:hypothetical protein
MRIGRGVARVEADDPVEIGKSALELAVVGEEDRSVEEDVGLAGRQIGCTVEIAARRRRVAEP